MNCCKKIEREKKILHIISISIHNGFTKNKTDKHIISGFDLVAMAALNKEKGGISPLIIDLCKLEHTNLKRELVQLKTCQVQYFTFAISASIIVYGILLSDINNIDVITLCSNIYFCLLFLIPLGVIIPTMWIFIDKAKTISRIVGYYFWIEKLLLDDEKIDKGRLRFLGWETALTKYRELSKEWEDETPDETSHFRKVVIFLYDWIKNPRGYIIMGWVALLGFTLLSCSPIWLYTGLKLWTYGLGAFEIGIQNLAKLISLIFGLGVTVIAIVLTQIVFSNLFHILYGKYSDIANQEKWEKILFPSPVVAQENFK